MATSEDIARSEQRFPHLAGLPPTPADSLVGTPDRRPGSVRRTSTIDMVWPGGFEAGLQLLGRSRDLLTPERGEARVLDAAELRARVDGRRTVHAIESTPAREGIEGIVGATGGTELRGAIDRALPGERESATALHLLLDDVAGTSLIAGFAMYREPGFEERMREHFRSPQAEPHGMRKGKIICSGLRPGGWAATHRTEGERSGPGIVPAGDIRTPHDPLGWHEWPPTPDPGMRRHRRVDVWREGDRLRVDAFFRDAYWDREGAQWALHEYSVDAEVDAAQLTLVSAEATPRVLPYPECRWAAPHAQQLEGLPVASFRTSVQRTLTELEACTHLNDMLRCLAEVPALSKHL